MTKVKIKYLKILRSLMMLTPAIFKKSEKVIAELSDKQ